jgi:hypothetical protein
VLGQLLTPVLILSAGQWLSLALIARFAAADAEVLVAVAALVLPGNLILVAVENLYFLWYPYRSVGINSFDFQAMGRQLLLLSAKLATAGLAAGVAAGFAAGAYYLTGRSFLPALAVAWVAAVVCGLGLVPLVAVAFDRFDVAHERTE